MEQNNKLKTTCASLGFAVVALAIVVIFGLIYSIHYCKDYKSKYDNSVQSNGTLNQTNASLNTQNNELKAENEQLKQLDGIVALANLVVATECQSYLANPTTYSDTKIKLLINFYGQEFSRVAGAELAEAVNFELKYHSPVYFVKETKLYKISISSNAVITAEESGTVGGLSAANVVIIATYNGDDNAPLTIKDNRITKITDTALQAKINSHS